MEAIKLLLSTRRNIITLIVIAVLGIGLLAGLWLVQRQTQLKSKAAASLGGEVKFRGSNVSGEGCTASSGDCVATDRNIQLQITNPFSSPAP